MKAVFVFRSKTEVFEFAERLKQRSIPAGTVGTPKEARIGCGLSVRTDLGFVGEAKKIAVTFDGFYGIFLIERTPNRSSVTRIY